MPASVDLLRRAAAIHQNGGDDEDFGIAPLIAALKQDLNSGGSSRVDTLRGLLDVLCSKNDSDRTAAAQVFNYFSWEAIGLTLALVGNPFAAVESGAHAGLSDEDNERIVSSSASMLVETLAQRLLVVMAEAVSAKELHLLALEHLQGSYNPKILHACLGLLRVSTQHMSPSKRIKFLDATMPPALENLKRMYRLWEEKARPKGAVTMNDDMSDADSDVEASGDEDDEFSTTLTDAADGEGGYATISASTREAAAKTAEAAVDFIGPLLHQAGEERARAYPFQRSPNASNENPTASDEVASILAPGLETGSNGATSTTYGAGEQEMVDRSLSSFLAFALSALSVLSGKSSVADSEETKAGEHAVTAGSLHSSEDGEGQKLGLAESEARIVEHIARATSAVGLPYLLSHCYRVAYSAWLQQNRPGVAGESGGEGKESSLPRRNLCERSRLGDFLAASDGLQEVNLGVSTLAHLVACNPKLRDQWLPMVWSPQMERRLFLPHAESLMGVRSKIIAGKGLDLACFVAKRLGHLPDGTGTFPFSWPQPGERSSANRSEGNHAAIHNEDVRQAKDDRQWQGFDPYRIDIAAFLQVLLDVIVTCPLADLRGRGHAAMESFLGAVDPGSRFRVLRRLVERCPWPNATGLLLDAFRREIDRGVRWRRLQPAAAAAEGKSPAASGAAEDLSSESPFASLKAGEFVSEQLLKACASNGLPSSLLANMDSRTGALALARYAYILDRTKGAGKLELRRPAQLRRNCALVQGLLDTVRKVTTLDSTTAAPDHFRLFILEDMAQQCLKELTLD